MCSISLFAFGTLCSHMTLSDSTSCFLFFLFLTLSFLSSGRKIDCTSGDEEGHKVSMEE